MKIIKKVILAVVILTLLYLSVMFFGVSTTARVSDVSYEYYNTYFSYDSPEFYSEKDMRVQLRDWFDITETEIDEIVSNPKEYIWVYCTFEIKNSTPFPINDLYITIKNLRKNNEIIPEKLGSSYIPRTIKPFESYEETVCFLIKDPNGYKSSELAQILSKCSVCMYQLSYYGIFASYRPMIKFE